MKTIRQQIEERYKPGVSFHPIDYRGIVLTDKVYTIQENWVLEGVEGRNYYFREKDNNSLHDG